MSKIQIRPFLLTFILVVFLQYVVYCDFDNQPRIIAHEGDLVFQSAQDKNITIRLSGSSRFMINDINVLESLQKVSIKRSPSDDTEIASLPRQVQNLKIDVRRLTNRLRRVENRTSSFPTGLIRRLQVRVRTLFARVADIETKLRDDDCASNPCENGGTCFDLYENFHCECPDAWTGKTCDQDVDECYSLTGTDLGCQNNAVCVNLPGSYRCVCTSGFTGTHCRDRGTECSKSRPGELCGNGACIPANNDLGYDCICDPGWKADVNTKSCTNDVNECLEMLVPCHTSCINLPGSFMCGPCPNGYTGNGVTCRDIDECATNNGGCSTLPKVQCINTEGSHRCGNCPPGWTGDGRYCSQAETNACPDNNICHPLATCEYISNVMICICPRGLSGSGYGPDGCSSASTDPCSEHQCQNGGTCLSRGSTYSCICPAGFDQPFCQIINPCAYHPCLNGGTCSKQDNSNDFHCLCPRGTTGRFCQNKRNTCGSVIRDRNGDLTYPNDGGEYKQNEACAWVIRTDENLILNVTFTRFNVQPDPECSKDWLQINDGRSLATPLIGRFCGSQLPNDGKILSSQSTLFLWFRTDNTTNSEGFSLSWNSIAPICGGRQEVDGHGHGVIKSPGYPGKSPPKRDCEWVIEAPFDKRILLRFYEVVMDRSANCTKDSLAIYDSNELLERVCESGVPPPKYTSSNLAKIHFHTDPYREDSLFQVHYEVVDGNPGCGGLFTEPEGKFSLALNMLNCVFLIQQPPGTRISIAFTNMQLERTIEVLFTTITVFDGKTDNDPVLAKSNEGSSLPSKLSSSGNFMLIVVSVKHLFINGGNVITDICEANYKMLCGEELRKPEGGTFMTPHYPQPYYTGLNCEYSIVGPLDSVVHLNISDYNISEYEEGCTDDADFIEIYYTISGSAERRCKDTGMHIVAPNNFLRIVFHSNTNPQKRRGFMAEYHFEQLGCGGVLQNMNGIFKLLDPVSASNVYCEWILEAPKDHEIHLDLLYRRTGTKCTTGEPDLRIFLNGTDSGDRLVESHCGGEKHLLTILPTNLATIFLKLVSPALGSAVSYSIQGNYTFTHRTSNCGGNYTIQSGFIQSPGWPNKYYDSLDCIWVIHAPLGHKIELVPRNFSLEPGLRCGEDYLEIRNGMSDKSPLIGTYCGTDIPSHIPSFTNHLYLHFHSDSSLPFLGFYIPFQQTATGCGGSLNSHSGSIASPHYPEISRGPVQCDWKITVSQGSAIDVRITRLGALTDFCSNGVLTLYDGDNSLANKVPIICTKEESIIAFSSSKNVLFVRYTVPEVGAAENQQFYLSYSTNCKQTLDSFVGVIESPNFPEDYPSLLDCEWNILGRKADTISLTFSHFQLETRNAECIYDVFEIVDMKDDETLQTRNICRNPAEVITSDGNKLVVKFSTDYNRAGTGFRLEYKRNGCGGYMTRVSGIIASPKEPYSVDVNCEWMIEAAPGKQIVLDLFDVHIESMKDDCSGNGLIVRNDKDSKKELLRECRVQSMPMTVTSEGNTMFIRFYTDSVRSRKYLKASYRTRDAQCGGIFRGNKGEITSPNYPQNYSTNTYCDWMISVEGSAAVEFEFDSLDLPLADEHCTKAFVELYDGIKSDEKSKLIGRYCQEPFLSIIPKRTITSRLNVIFSSGDGPPGKGFALKFEKSCGGMLTEDSGFLKSYLQDGSCLWIIEKREGTKIVINFMHIECNCEGLDENECYETRGVRVSPVLLTAYSQPALDFCEHHPLDFISDGSTLIVNAKNVTFIAKYSTIETTCGGLLTSLRGSFTSPYYPQTYPSNIECIWTIQAQPGNYLELNFEEMDITKSDNCNQDYLEVRENSPNGRLLGLYCSNIKPDEGLQVFQQFWIKFRSSEDGVGKGFKLSWRYAQMNAITGFNGQIQSPPIVSIRSEKEPFKWRITVPRDNVISLRFAEYNGGLKLYDGFDSDALPIEIQFSPWDITSSTNVIFLIADNQMLDRFRITWKALSKDAITKNELVQDCNETLNIAYGALVSLTSPGYPKGYEQNLQCQWLVKSDHNTRHAVVRLMDVRLETLDNCFADYLQISSSKNLIDWHEELKICDIPIPVHLIEIHGTPNLKLTFVTDGSLNRTGFKAVLYTECGGNLTGSIGRILDVDVHNTAKEELIKNCTWHIEVRAGRKIEFTFEFPLNTAKKSSDECSNYALLRDGIDDGAPILPPGRICSYQGFNGTVFTTTNYATVRYYMQPHNPFLLYGEKMWNLTYREYNECGGEVRLTPYSASVNISSPNYPNVPNSHTECLWTIVAPPGEAVQAQFVDSFDMNIRYCGKEYVEFRDGSTELARLLGKYCFPPATTIHSSGNVLYMRYLTDIAEPRSGFKVNISLSKCGGTFTQVSNIITSANYPAPGGYPANSVCDYVIKVSMYARLNLSFIDLNLPFDKENVNGSDHLKVYSITRGDGTQNEYEFTSIYGNTTSMPSLQIDSNEILIRLFSYKANNLYRGFKVKYERIFGLCNKDVSGESGLLTFSVTPRRIQMFVMCRWKITVPKGRRIQIKPVDGVDIHSAETNRNIRITFFNDFYMRSSIKTLDLVNLTRTTAILSTDNKMLVRIFGSYTSTILHIPFAYTSLETSNCPDDIMSDTGSLSISSLAPISSFFCSSDFVLNGMQTLSFNISRFVAEIVEAKFSPGFGVRFKVIPSSDILRVLMSNVTNAIVAVAGRHGSVEILQNNVFLVKQFEATFKKHPCGGEYAIGNKFEISLPNLTARYGSLDCAWHLSGTENQKGYEMYTYVIKFTLPCENEYVVVHAGTSADKLQVARLCGSDTLNVTHVQSENAYVHYHTTAYSPSSELQIALQRTGTCGEKLQIEKNEFVQFTSADYKNNLECVWEFQTLPGFFLRLEFSGRFYIEDSKDCVKDYLEVRTFEQGAFVPLPRYCGRNMPAALNTTSNRVQLIFRSDNASTGDGFTLEVQKTCYAVFNVTNRPQFIVYPSRWSTSTFRMRCDYILQTDSNKHIQVKFITLTLGFRNRCILTRLSAQKKTSSGELIDLGPYCKDNAVSELRAKKFIALSYRSLIEIGGYEIEFFLDDCGGQVTQSMWIASLKNENGDGYVDNMNCVWNITAPEGHNIVILFKYLVMEELDGCNVDFVAVYRGPYATDDQMEAKICGNLTTNAPTFHIDGNSAVVVAMSDSSITKDGFSARIIFSKACDERLTLTPSNSPVDIVRNLTVGSNETMFCSYRIMGTPGFRIEIELTKIELNLPNVTCNEECEYCEYLEVVDSLQGGGLTLGKYCSLGASKPKLMSSYKDAVLRIHLERQGNHQIVAKLRLVPSRCGDQAEHVLEGESGVQISPLVNLNGLYSSNMHCTWKITSKRDFEMRFQHFNLQNVSDATGRCLDYVLVTYTANYVHKNYYEHCGSISSFIINVDKYTSEASADITFHSDEAIESTGFTLTATNRAACNRTFNDTSGVIKGVFDINENCIYDIYMPDNYMVNIIMPSYYLRETNCSANYIRAYDINTNRQIYESCAEDYTMRKIFTSTNRVRLDFKVKQSYSTDIFYYGSRKPSLTGCGGNLTVLQGMLASPNYGEYGNASVCRWNLTTTPPNRFEINFSEFNMGSVCRVDYLNIIEISANGDEKEARHYCESNMPQTYISESSRLAIVSVATADFDGTGWALIFGSYIPWRS